MDVRRTWRVCRGELHRGINYTIMWFIHTQREFTFLAFPSLFPGLFTVSSLAERLGLPGMEGGSPKIPPQTLKAPLFSAYQTLHWFRPFFVLRSSSDFPRWGHP